MPLRRLTLAVAALLAITAPSAARAAGPDAGAVLDMPVSNGEIAKLQQSGTKSARLFMFETANAPSVFDDTVSRLNAAGIKPLFVVVGDRSNPPTTDTAVAAYSRYLTTAAQRFKGRVAGWEIWNEEDAPKWWAGAPAVDGTARDAGPYVNLLQSAYKAVKAVEDVPVVMGGLTGNDYLFLADAYRKGAKGSFDVVATHTDTACNLVSPYSFYKDATGAIAQFSFLGYRSVRAVMEANGDPKPIWMTEFGWSTTSRGCDQGLWAGQKAGGVSEADQATFIGQAVHCMARDPYVEKAYIFRLVEEGGDTPDAKFGLLTTLLGHKPAFDAFSVFAQQGDTRPADEACGDFSAPVIQMLELGDKAATGVYAKRLHVKVRVTDPQVVGRITFLLDGRKIRNFTTSKGTTMVAAMDIDSAKKLPNGRHKLTVVAKDLTGNQGAQDFVVKKVAPKPVKKKRRR